MRDSVAFILTTLFLPCQAICENRRPLKGKTECKKRSGENWRSDFGFCLRFYPQGFIFREDPFQKASLESTPVWHLGQLDTRNLPDTKETLVCQVIEPFAGKLNTSGISRYCDGCHTIIKFRDPAIHFRPWNLEESRCLTRQ